MGTDNDEAVKLDIPQVIIAALGALLVGGLYLALPEKLTFGPTWLLLGVEALLLAPSLVSSFFLQRALPYPVARGLAVALLIVLTLALISSIVLLVSILPSAKGTQLLRPASVLWLSNVLIFATWYWETDDGGPRARSREGHRAKDFRFPQDTDHAMDEWRPGFVDYLFLAFCSATALSPADTMPLTQRAKLLMMMESTLSLLILVLLVARSVNIIGG